MRLSVTGDLQYLGGAHTRKEALAWARTVADRDGQVVKVERRNGSCAYVTPRGARSALTRARRKADRC